MNKENRIKKVRLVAFDVNGTLFDDTKIFWDAINGIFPRYGKESLPIEVLKERFGQPWTALYRAAGITEAMASDKELYAIYNGLYRNGDAPMPVAGLAEVLRWLKAKGVQLAIVSTQQNEITEPLLKKYRLDGLFSPIMGAVSDKSVALREIARSAGIPPQEMAYVGDQEGDARHAKSAGCVSIAFCGGLHDHARLKKIGPDFIIETMGELKDLPIF
ncbi:HAD family hydrolase [Patescibacteria group bacterium]|nr:HAD family hydrolase [Patescibacteria group bacterium]